MPNRGVKLFVKREHKIYLYEQSSPDVKNLDRSLPRNDGFLEGTCSDVTTS